MGAISALAALTVQLEAAVRLPGIFSDHMVLQTGKAVPVWGWAGPGEEIAVSIAGQSKSTKADSDGRWKVELDQLAPSSQGQTLTVAGTNTLAVNDVVIGEVWLCSGQSNMALRVEGTYKSDEEIPAAKNPAIRMFFVRSDGAETPQSDCVGAWEVCSPETVGRFAATAYYFGKELNRVMGTPVGLINASVGGTRIEAWTSTEAQKAVPELAARVQEYEMEAARFNPEQATAKYERELAAWRENAQKLQAEGKTPPRQPVEPLAARKKQGRELGMLFNAKIAPLIPYGIRGAIWYQGEANSGPDRVGPYEFQMATLIKDWRTRWGSEFPFAWVQLPNFQGGPGRDWPALREAQLKTLKVNNTGMAIALDLGEAGNIHSIFKPEVGRRLALWALGAVYNKGNPTSGPLPVGHEIRNGEVVIRFSHTDGGLVVRGADLGEFLIAGEDRQWKPGRARIENDTVVVSHPEVPAPAAVRYAWSNNPYATLYNGAGLPASPFRTDDWQSAALPEPPERHDVPAAVPASAPGPSSAPAPIATSGENRARAVPVSASQNGNILQNGDFQRPINTDRKRGTWTLVVAKGGPYDLAPDGFSTSGGVLEIDMDQLNPDGKAKPAIQFCQLIRALSPGQKYRLSFEARADQPGITLLVGAGVVTSGHGEMAGGLARTNVPLTAAFSPQSFEFTASEVPEGMPDPQKYSRVDFRFESPRGKICLKNIRLEECE